MEMKQLDRIEYSLEKDRIEYSLEKDRIEKVYGKSIALTCGKIFIKLVGFLIILSFLIINYCNITSYEETCKAFFPRLGFIFGLIVGISLLFIPVEIIRYNKKNKSIKKLNERFKVNLKDAIQRKTEK